MGLDRNVGEQLVLLVAAVAFWAYCLRDFARADELAVRRLPKEAWLIVLVLGNVVGGALWMLAGRPVSRPRA